MIRVLSLQVENNPGVLARIAGLFSGKGYNLESITAGATTDSGITRITLVCKGDDVEFEQIKNQLNRLIEVVKVTDLNKHHTVRKELAFIKICTKSDHRVELFNIAKVFGAKVIDITLDTMMLEVLGSSRSIDDLLAVLQTGNVLEVARSGLVAMEMDRKQ